MKKIRKSVISLLMLASLVAVMAPTMTASAAARTTAAPTINPNRVIFIIRKLPRVASQTISRYADITQFIGSALALQDSGLIKDPVYLLAKQVGMTNFEARMVSTGLTPLLNLN